MRPMDDLLRWARCNARRDEASGRIITPNLTATAVISVAAAAHSASRSRACHSHHSSPSAHPSRLRPPESPPLPSPTAPIVASPSHLTDVQSQHIPPPPLPHPSLVLCILPVTLHLALSSNGLDLFSALQLISAPSHRLSPVACCAG